MILAEESSFVAITRYFYRFRKKVLSETILQPNWARFLANCLPLFLGFLCGRKGLLLKNGHRKALRIIFFKI
jgi:hypothetical protein